MSGYEKRHAIAEKKAAAEEQTDVKVRPREEARVMKTKASAKALFLSNVIIISCSIPGIAFHQPDICFSQSFKQRIIDVENKNPKNRLKIKNLTPAYEKGKENPYLTKEAENECSYLAEYG